MLHCVAVCCSVLQCVAEWCSVSQCVAVGCSVMTQNLLHVGLAVQVCWSVLGVCWSVLECADSNVLDLGLAGADVPALFPAVPTLSSYSVLQYIVVCCSESQCHTQCVAVCCSVLQCVAMCCNVLQCVAVCCSVL